MKYEMRRLPVSTENSSLTQMDTPALAARGFEKETDRGIWLCAFERGTSSE